MDPIQYLADLKKILPEDRFSTDASDLQEYGKDWTKRFAPNASIIFFPRSTEEVQKFLKFCNNHTISVVPSGGRTGLAGGAVATNREIVLSLSKMNKMGEVNTGTRLLWTEAGAVTQGVHDHCQKHGLTWPVDFASKGSSHVGGNIATNAGGVRVLRFGLTRQWVSGLTVVLATGDRMDLNGSLEKNNTGIDLRQLFIGSEGILGVITEVILKLAPLPKEVETFYFPCRDLAQVMQFFSEIRKTHLVLQAFEVISKNCLESCVQFMGNRTPFQTLPEYAVLLEVEKSDDSVVEQIYSAMEASSVEDCFPAQNMDQSREFWAIRENITESMVKQGLVHKHDISVGIEQIEQFIKELKLEAKNFPDLKTFIFGHIGDGNLHINYLKPQEMAREDFYLQVDQLDQRMFVILNRLRGSVSAEHGIGLIKKAWLGFSRSPLEIDLMKQLKRVFDPKGILNPGKILDI